MGEKPGRQRRDSPMLYLDQIRPVAATAAQPHACGHGQTSQLAQRCEDAGEQAGNAPICWGVEMSSAGRCKSAMFAKVMPHFIVGAQKWTASPRAQANASAQIRL
jgi:hypothetical protein